MLLAFYFSPDMNSDDEYAIYIRFHGDLPDTYEVYDRAGNVFHYDDVELAIKFAMTLVGFNNPFTKDRA